MKYRILVAAVVLFASCSGLFAQKKLNKIIVKGFFEGDLKGAEKIYISLGRSYFDSAVIKEGRYSFELPFKEPGYVELTPEYSMKGGWRHFGILADKPGVYTIHSDVSKPFTSSVITGTTNTWLYGLYNGEMDNQHSKMRDAFISIHGDFSKQDSATNAKIDSLKKIYVIPAMEAFIRKHHDEYVAPFILVNDGLYGIDFDQQQKLYSLLSPAMKSTNAGKQFGNYLQGIINSRPGHLVPDFTLPDSNGKNISFYSSKGKYRMVDFWASWCLPCRASFPRMRQLYQQYAGPDFEILSISIDQVKKDWKKAMQEEKNPWPQMLDTKKISRTYFGVTGVPTVFLIDPQGKIVLRESGFDPNGGSAIEKKLQTLNLVEQKSDSGMQFVQHSSWTKILAKAKEENKLIFVDCYATWCGPCKKMAKEVFPLADVGAFYNANYINVKAQMDSSASDGPETKERYADNHMILSTYGISAYPSYLIFSPDGQLVHRFTGAMPAADFIKNGRDALLPDKQFYTQLRKYEAGERSAPFLYRLAKLSASAGQRQKGVVVFNEYLKTQTNLFTKENMELIQAYTRSTRDTGFAMMLKSPNTVDSLMGTKESETEVMYIIMNEELLPHFYAKAADSLALSPNWDSVHTTIAAKYPPAAKRVIENAKIFYYRYNRQWGAYGSAVDDYMRDFADDLSYQEVNLHAWTIYEHCDDPTLIASAALWSKNSFAQNNDVACIDTYAHLLLKSGRKEEAIEWETKALNQAKQNKSQDISVYEEALNKMKQI